MFNELKQPQPTHMAPVNILSTRIRLCSHLGLIINLLQTGLYTSGKSCTYILYSLTVTVLKHRRLSIISNCSNFDLSIYYIWDFLDNAWKLMLTTASCQKCDCWQPSDSLEPCMHALSYLDLLLRLRNLFEDKCRQIRGTHNNSQQKRKKIRSYL